MDFFVQEVFDEANSKLWGPDVIVDYAELRIIWASDRFVSELGFGKDDIAGVSLREVMLLDDEQVKGLVASLLSHERNLIATLVTKSGKLVRVNTIANIIKKNANTYVVGKIV